MRRWTGRARPVVGGARGRAAALAWAAAWAAAAGCADRAAPPEPVVRPVSVLQHRAHPEAATGRFVSLADFEASGISARPGYAQVGHFRVLGGGAGAELKYVVNITRTGVGAMEALLPPGAVLEFRLPEVHDVRAYTLLLAAIYSRGIRDDLTVRLQTDRASWQALPLLLEPGWNSVRVDLARLKVRGDFDARGVRAIRLSFPASASPVRINLDDVMLIDNRRRIEPVPSGMALSKSGLDYALTLPGRSRPVRIRQGDDGLWRLGPDQAAIALAAGGAPPAPAEKGPGREDLSAFGSRRVGRVEIVEHNALRVRVRNTWYFPASAGEWESMAIRQIRWEYAFYPDGRWVTDVIVNNAGGAELKGLRITAPSSAAWSGRSRSRRLDLPGFRGAVGRWSFLTAAGAEKREVYETNYLKPARIRVRMGRQEACDGDVEDDGFDESQGCYHVRAKAGHCRFRVLPADGPLADAVFRVRGRWSGSVAASSEGLALRTVRVPGEGAVLFVVPGLIQAPRWVEVTGRVPLIGGD